MGDRTLPATGDFIAAPVAANLHPITRGRWKSNARRLLGISDRSRERRFPSSWRIAGVRLELDRAEHVDLKAKREQERERLARALERPSKLNGPADGSAIFQRAPAAVVGLASSTPSPSMGTGWGWT